MIGVLLVVAGAGYAFDSFVDVLTESSPFAVSNVTFLGEFLLGCLARSFRGPPHRQVGGSGDEDRQQPPSTHRCAPIVQDRYGARVRTYSGA